ncbi:phosphoribosylformylglycinamidine cyclo-ligase [Methylacidiphilum caldifontis]|uniref:Phosphoribosylformylglycinamidine cyclo-ligase n=1 Tax=Methylacidiphilum caldifontis TaxID=2795386 RepID=A0A4Y8P7L0_9BACT|nr:phosphoribosylformylglycinamidine cyclo-ligase [Methylacidiphilum caldifontis]QSR88872.1 phosphoribosylformylglycinamidine cyclo-ligase [Methylacidiphilum caldifontis]TFE66219.1 phosphoribosylformylglycinamidine cyclo-ligase [Methylacidiphilum caldifontis]
MNLYSKAGVDINAAQDFKSKIPSIISPSRRPEVIGNIGGFGGLFSAFFPHLRHPVLVSSIDGVGTKLIVGQMANRLESLGEDLVNHCVNDIGSLGADPLFFLDYIGCGKLDSSRFLPILQGMAKACQKAGCALLGGETAQMPGLYKEKDFDLVGAIVGVVDKENIIDGKTIRANDLIIGLPSSGLHTNGYSLVRKLLFEQNRFDLWDIPQGLNRPLAEELLEVHKSYLKEIQLLRGLLPIKGIAHITGGGFLENIPRILPHDVDAIIYTNRWPIPALFSFLTKLGSLSIEERYTVFNMGIGLCLVIAPEYKEQCLKHIDGYLIGNIIPGNGKVHLQ